MKEGVFLLLHMEDGDNVAMMRCDLGEASVSGVLLGYKGRAKGLRIKHDPRVLIYVAMMLRVPVWILGQDINWFSPTIM